MVIEYQQLARDRRSQNRSIQIDKSFTVDGVFFFSAKCTISSKRKIHKTLKTKSLWKWPILMGLGKRFKILPYSFQSNKKIYFHRHTRGLF